MHSCYNFLFCRQISASILCFNYWGMVIMESWKETSFWGKKLILGNFTFLSKKGYGCKWTWETIQLFIWTQTTVKKKVLFWCSIFHNHSRVFSNKNNSYPKMSMKQPLACSWAVLFTSIDKLYMWASLSFRWCIRCCSLCFIFSWPDLRLFDLLSDKNRFILSRNCCYMILRC